MNHITRTFNQLIKLANKPENGHKRHSRHAALGIRNDGTKVTATNIPTIKPHPQSHAEARLARKLTPGSTIYIIRITRAGTLTQSRPCPTCRQILKNRGITTIHYSIAPNEHGTIHNP